MKNNKIQAIKGSIKRSFTTHIWDLLPANKNGWTAINIPVEVPKEAVKVNLKEPVKESEIKTPPEAVLPLPPKVSIKKGATEVKPKAKAKNK